MADDYGVLSLTALRHRVASLPSRNLPCHGVAGNDLNSRLLYTTFMQSSTDTSLASWAIPSHTYHLATKSTLQDMVRLGGLFIPGGFWDNNISQFRQVCIPIDDERRVCAGSGCDQHSVVHRYHMQLVWRRPEVVGAAVRHLGVAL